MTRKKLLLVYLVVLLGLFLPSCQIRSGETQAGTVVRSYAPQALVENSRIVGNRLRVLHRDTEWVNGLLRVQITVENVSKEGLEFEYRYTWFDGKGFEVETPASVWQSVEVLAKDEAYLTGIAPSEEVTDFKLVVRYPKVR